MRGLSKGLEKYIRILDQNLGVIMNTTTGFHGVDAYVELCNFRVCGWRSQPLVIGLHGGKDEVMAKLKQFGREHIQEVHKEWDDQSYVVV